MARSERGDALRANPWLVKDQTSIGTEFANEMEQRLGIVKCARVWMQCVRGTRGIDRGKRDTEKMNVKDRRETRSDRPNDAGKTGGYTGVADQENDRFRQFA